MTTPELLIQKTRELCKAATPGPWVNGYDAVLTTEGDRLARIFRACDGELISAAPTLLLELADALEAEVGERKPEESLLTQRHADMILNDRSELRRVNRELIRELANHKAKMVD